MNLLAKDPRVVFLGQAVEYQGTSMSQTLESVSMLRRMEMPVAEEMQMGISIGLALGGLIPVSFYPRWNFLLLATNQLVNHLDKLPQMGYDPHVIIRVGVGAQEPLYPGPQHSGDFSGAFRKMFTTIKVERVPPTAKIVDTYRKALKRGGATILVENSELYG